MQSKDNLKFHLTPVGVTKTNNKMKTLRIGADTVEVTVEVPQQPKNRFTRWPSHCTPRHVSEGLHVLL